MTCNKNPEKITKIFDKISPYYDKMNNFISFGTHYFIKKSAIKLLRIKPNSMILDICCGTGDFTNIINKINPKSKIIGIDNSVKMIKLAKQKNPKNTFLKADCTNIPFNKNEFDFATIGFGLRNIENREKALSEIYRILKPNGIFLHLDFGKHNTLNKIFDYILKIIIKIIKVDYESYTYLIESKKTYPEPNELIEEFSKFGFKFLDRKDYFLGAISCQIMIKPSIK